MICEKHTQIQNDFWNEIKQTKETIFFTRIQNILRIYIKHIIVGALNVIVKKWENKRFCTNQC